MKKYIFLSSYLKNRVFIFFIITYLLSGKLFLLFFGLYLLFLWLFRKKINTELRSGFFSPFTGKVIKVEEHRVEVKISIFDDYGLCSLGDGEVVSYFESCEEKKVLGLIPVYSFKSKFTLKLAELGKIKYEVQSLRFTDKSTVWIRSGDYVKSSAYLGYLPFGGKVAIETPSNVMIEVNKKSKLKIFKTKFLDIR